MTTQYYGNGRLGMTKEEAERYATAWTERTGVTTRVLQNPEGTWDWDIVD